MAAQDGACSPAGDVDIVAQIAAQDGACSPAGDLDIVAQIAGGIAVVDMADVVYDNWA
jgi:hypothetical protein